jgi:hypothetical protein
MYIGLYGVIHQVRVISVNTTSTVIHQVREYCDVLCIL